MDLSIPGSTPNSPLTPVFGDNVQDLLGTGALNINPSAIITVNSIADTVDDPSSGIITLRDAINQANADNGQDLIVFDRSLFSNAQTITLSGTELDITHNLDIIAPRDSLTGEDLVTVSGNKATRVFEIEEGATVSIDGLIVADGNVIRNLGGGGIKNSGTLTLDNCHLSGNGNPLQYSYGGGIYNSGTLTVNNSRISGNTSSYGGGIYNNYNNATLTLNNSFVSDNLTSYNGGGILNGGILTVNNSTISGNQVSIPYFTGGGIYSDGILTVSNSTISNNRADGGGGIDYRNLLNDLTVSNSTISNNIGGQGGGGIYNNRTVNVSNSTISGNLATFGGGISGNVILTNSTLVNNSANFGGGIYGSGVVSNSTISNNKASYGGGINSSGTLTVSNSTLSGNSAANNGGGIFNGKNPVSSGGTVNVSNSTLSGNTALNDGGGIFNDKTLTLVFSTLTLNSASLGGGMFNDALGNASARNTIIAANLFSTDGINPDVSGTFTSFGYNLIGSSTGTTGFDEAIGDIVGTADNPIDPRLAPLDFNGGSTQTIALLPDSPAIDAGDQTVLDTDPTTDQRGLPRRALDGSTDIGSYQFSS